MNIAKILGFLFAGASLTASDLTVIWEQPITGTFGQGVTLGDVDKDGDLDALITYDITGSLLFLNNGNGAMIPADHEPMISSAAEAALEDLDGDGDVDLFLARHLASCEVWLNDGTGVFTNSGQVLGPQESRTGLKLADVDKDGDLDAVVPTDSSAGANRLFFNDGNGVFTESSQTLGSVFARNADTGDVDDDGDLDIAFAINGRNKLWLNDGNGVFTESDQNFGVNGTFDIAFGDLDGDGDLDLYFANGRNSIPSEGSEVWLNDGSGTFTNSGQSIGEEYTFQVVLSDVDDDGDLDALEGTNSTMPNKVWLNDGAGVFTDSGEFMGFSRAIGLATGDLNGDARPDYVLAANLDPSEIWFGVDADNRVADSGQRLGGSAASAVASGDVDGDGDLDLAVGAIGGNVNILFNDGTGQFNTPKPSLPNGFGNNNGALAFGDVDKDGDLDLVVANSQYSSTADVQTRLWLNDGSGGFALGTILFSDSPNEGLAVVDLDDDGDLDIVTASQKFLGYSGQNHIFFNDGSGSFTRVDALGSEYVFDVVPGDFDGDTDLDLLLTGNNEPSKLWLNDGNGNFTDSGQAIGSSRTRRADAADVDGDGDLDLICGNFNQNNVLWLNDGNGTFSDAGQALNRGSTRDVKFIDFNNDPHPDIWIGNGSTNGNPDWIYLNDGAGQFTLAQTTDARSTAGIAPGDFTGDGTMDVLIVSQDGNHALWSRPQPVADVEAYAQSFNLSGDDILPGADPDKDGLPNFAEMAFNLNPNSPDADRVSDTLSADKGTPAVQVINDDGSFEIQALVIRRLNAPNFDYRFITSPGLTGFVEPTSIDVISTEIDENYELAVYTFPVPDGSARYFGMVELQLVEP